MGRVDAQPEVMRLETYRYAGALGVLASAGVLVATIGIFETAHLALQGAVFVVAGTFGAAISWRVMTAKVVADDAGITVRNVGTTTRVAWSDVAGFDTDRGSWWQGASPAVRRRSSDRPLRLYCLSAPAVPYGTARRQRQLLDRLNELWQRSGAPY